ISVEKLATSAMNVSADDKTININKPIAEFNFSMTEEGEITFQTYDEDGKNVTHKVKIDYENDTIKDVLNKINEQDNNVQAFYDEQSKRVVLETTRTGKYNVNNEGSGKEIEFSENSFFAKVLHMDVENEKGGENSSFIYNDHLTLTSKDNNYTLNGITFSFHDTGTSTLTVDNDTEAAFDSIMAFVDKYNEVVDVMNSSQREEKHRDFPPLTEAQKEEMTEKEIELWEEKAKSGLLRGDSTITNGLFSMRNSWYSKVETGGEITSLTQIGIETSSAYLDGGKLIVDEDKLRTALREDPDGVQKLFSNNEEKDSRGLVNRLEDSIEATMKSIERKAGKSTSTLENYTLGKQ